jgi:hypothetical protein
MDGLKKIMRKTHSLETISGQEMNQESPKYKELSINALQHLMHDEDQAFNIIKQGTT